MNGNADHASQLGTAPYVATDGRRTRCLVVECGNEVLEVLAQVRLSVKGEAKLLSDLTQAE
ncbi:MAG TPA: hypothetical protein VKP30_18810 [Polyangiaceae bacterium]|nr:hypothetical protein [Polyangiaceae bacterium]